jgi:hypothetical protein
MKRLQMSIDERLLSLVDKVARTGKTSFLAF